MSPMHNLVLAEVLSGSMPHPIESDVTIINPSSTDGMTAFATGGQAGGTPLLSCYNRFTVVVTAGDSALLPPSYAGAQVIVKNASATSMNVFPAVGEVINALAANAAFAVATVKFAIFTCIKVGVWEAVAL